jgi:hypothetical protein
MPPALPEVCDARGKEQFHSRGRRHRAGTGTPGVSEGGQLLAGAALVGLRFGTGGVRGVDFMMEGMLEVFDDDDVGGAFMGAVGGGV